MKDTIGQKFNSLTALYPLEGVRRNSQIVWMCRCDCGKEVEVLGGALRYGRVKSCGCARQRAGERLRDMSLVGQTFNGVYVKEFYEAKEYKSYFRCICKCGAEFVAMGFNIKRGNTTSCGCNNNHNIEMVGKVFNKLTVISQNFEQSHHSRYWDCQCSCGNTTIVTTGNLLDNLVKSCGCARADAGRANRKTTILGKVFGKLTVLEYDESDPRFLQVRCLCECGNVTSVIPGNLSRGITRSCGCLRSEVQLTNPEDRELGYESWRNQIKEQYQNSCVVCSRTSTKNIAHHLYSVKAYPDMIFDVDNGVCLCVPCHKKFHKEYGAGNNTEEQFHLFLNTQEKKAA